MRPDAGALAGVRILVTRAAEPEERLAAALRARGATVASVPLLAFAPPSSWEAADAAIEALPRYAAILFTSSNGVARFWDRLQERVGSCDLPAFPASASIYAVGPRTADALRARGISAAAIPDEHHGVALAGEVVRRLGSVRAARILLPRAEVANEQLPDRLRAAGANVDVAAVYRTVVPEGAREALERALDDGVDVVTFASGSAVSHLVDLLGGPRDSAERLRGARIAALGAVTAARAAALGIPATIVSDGATVEALADALEKDAALRPPKE